MSEKNELGVKLRTIREAQNFTLVDLAEKSKCPLPLIEQIEAGELIPSLAPLIKITRALGVRLGTLLDDAEVTGPVITRAEKSGRGVNQAELQRGVIHFSGEEKHPASKPQLDFFALAPNKADRHMEPFLISVHSLSDAQHQLSHHEGEEFMYVLEGELEIVYGKETYRLQRGDSIYLDSVVPHHVHSAPNVETKMLAVIYEPR